MHQIITIMCDMIHILFLVAITTTNVALASTGPLPSYNQPMDPLLFSSKLVVDALFKHSN